MTIRMSPGRGLYALRNGVLTRIDYQDSPAGGTGDFPATVDSFQRKNNEVLAIPVAWCDANGLTYTTPDGKTARKLLIGEWGTPRGDKENNPYPDADESAWQLTRAFYVAQLVRQGVWGTFWADGPSGYEMLAHKGEGSGPFTTMAAGTDLQQSHLRHIWGANGVNRMDSEWSYDSWMPQAMVNFYSARNISLARVSILWNFLAGSSGSTLTTQAVNSLTGMANRVSAATCSNGAPMQVIIDLHNYCMRRDGVAMTEAEFSDTWWNIANLPAIKNNPRVHFGLMNEPSNRGASFGKSGWDGMSSRLITRLRNAGISNRIFVSPWNFWPEAVNDYPTKWWNDPLDNTWLELHHYFDYDEGGSYGSWGSYNNGRTGDRSRYAFYRDNFGTGDNAYPTDGLIPPQSDVTYVEYGPYSG